MAKKPTAGEIIADETISLPLDLNHEDAKEWIASRIDAAIAAERARCVGVVEEYRMSDLTATRHSAAFICNEIVNRIEKGGE